MSSHKLYGPKGVGALYIRKGTRMIPLLHGGEQERKRRAGTENVPGIIGFGKAMEIAQAQMEQKQCQIANFRDKLIKGLFERIDGIRLNGHPLQRLPNNVSVCIEGVEGEAMLLNLDMKGICASSGYTIIDVKFKNLGCGAAIATSSMVTEMVKGKTIDEALRISNKTVAEALDGLPPIKMHCSVLAEQALHAAVKDYLGRKNKS